MVKHDRDVLDQLARLWISLTDACTLTNSLSLVGYLPREARNAASLTLLPHVSTTTTSLSLSLSHTHTVTFVHSLSLTQALSHASLEG